MTGHRTKSRRALKWLVFLTLFLLMMAVISWTCIYLGRDAADLEMQDEQIVESLPDYDSEIPFHFSFTMLEKDAIEIVPTDISNFFTEPLYSTAQTSSIHDRETTGKNSDITRTTTMPMAATTNNASSKKCEIIVKRTKSDWYLSIITPIPKTSLSTSSPMNNESSSAIKPIAKKSSSTIEPIAKKSSSTIKPIGKKSSSTMKPAAKKSSSTIKRITQKSPSTPKPIVKKPSSKIKPIAMQSSSTIEPTAKKSSSTIMPTAKNSASTLKPTAKKSSSTITPTAKKSVRQPPPSTVASLKQEVRSETATTREPTSSISRLSKKLAKVPQGRVYKDDTFKTSEIVTPTVMHSKSSARTEETDNIHSRIFINYTEVARGLESIVSTTDTPDKVLKRNGTTMQTSEKLPDIFFPDS